jgi:tetratricopeptide (TPR) repeat protein
MNKPTSMRWLILLLVIVTGQVTAAEPTWRMAITPHYKLLSQLSDRDTTEWMKNFDLFVLSTTDILHMDMRSLPPLTIVIFKRDKDYEPYKLLRPNGEIAKVAGQFARHPTWSIMGMARERDSDEFRRTIQHEATHWLMSADEGRQPAWFTEGIAEMFSTFERRADKVNWAKPIGHHVVLLRSLGLIPLNQFLTQPNAMFDRDEHTSHFYAQSWAFTHFLLLSKEPGRSQLLFNFLDTYKKKSGDATVQAVFGTSLHQIERELRAYIDQRSVIYMIQPAKEVAAPPPLQPASAVAVESALGFLALSARRFDVAKRHAEKAITLDANAAEGHAVLAYLALANKDFDQAVTHADAALQRDSKDSDLYMLIGDSYVNGPNSQKPNAEQIRINMYERAINLNPRRLAVYQRLTEVLVNTDKPREEDAKFLSLGLRAFPGEDWLRVGVASVDYRLGRHEAALTALDTVLRSESTLGEKEREFATYLQSRWLMEAMNSELQVAVSNKDFAEARAITSRYRDRIGSNPQLNAYLREVDARLEIPQLLAKYEAAQRANKKAEAKALAEQLLVLPNLPEDLRNHLKKRLAGNQ